jgi:hypothetical protein
MLVALRPCFRYLWVKKINPLWVAWKKNVIMNEHNIDIVDIWDGETFRKGLDQELMLKWFEIFTNFPIPSS